MVLSHYKAVAVAIVLSLLIASAVCRVVVLASVPQSENDLSAVKVAVTDWIQLHRVTPEIESPRTDTSVQIDTRQLPVSLTDLGVVSVAFEQFDPNATVYLRPGADGQPGVAGVDDNGNGIVDDDTELGATKTDDVLSVTAGEMDTEGPILILQRGAYVPVSREVATNGTAAWRAVVNGSAKNEGWSFLLQYDS